MVDFHSVIDLIFCVLYIISVVSNPVGKAVTVILSQKVFLTTYDMNCHLLRTFCLPGSVPFTLHLPLIITTLSEVGKIIPNTQRRQLGVSNLPEATQPTSGTGLRPSLNPLLLCPKSFCLCRRRLDISTSVFKGPFSLLKMEVHRTIFWNQQTSS